MIALTAIWPWTVQAARTPSRTATPIQHLIVIVGENQTFDALFATWRPRSGEQVNNLLSEGIVRADGGPGENFGRAAQRRAQPTAD